MRRTVNHPYTINIVLGNLVPSGARGCQVAKLTTFTGDHAILASLGTQFTLLMQTAIGIRNNLDDAEIAKFAQIGNVKRLYFLRRELQQISVEQLVWLNNQIKTTKHGLNYNNCSLTARLMLMCCY